MRELLIAYLLKDLSEEERLGVEESLRQDPLWQQELARLQTCLGYCEDASDNEVNPPGDLTTRTCCFIQNVSRLGTDPSYRETLLQERAPCDLGHRWSLMDLTVAGGILATLAMLLLPALHQGREASRRLACKNNLRAIGQALILYAEQNRQGLPHVASRENAGSFTVKLATSGMIDRSQLAALLVCPSSPLAEEIFSGRLEIYIPTARQLEMATPHKRLVIRRRMGGSYAYRLGYYDQGTYRPVRFAGRSDSPMLADAPAPQTDGFYSSYHGGCGSNCGEHVLFQDWSVRFCRPCISDERRDNIYLNADQQQAAGKGPRDIVLGRSEVRPDGR